MMANPHILMEQSPPPAEREKIIITQHIGDFTVASLPRSHGMFRINNDISVVTSDLDDVKPLFYPDGRQSSLHEEELDVGALLDMFAEKADHIGEQFGNVIRKDKPSEPRTVTVYKSNDPAMPEPLLQYYSGAGTAEDPHKYAVHASEKNSIKDSASHAIIAFANTAVLEQRPVYCSMNQTTILLEPCLENGQQIIKLSAKDTGFVPRDFATIALEAEADLPVPLYELRYYFHCLDHPEAMQTPEVWGRQKMGGIQMVDTWFKNARQIITNAAPAAGAPNNTAVNSVLTSCMQPQPTSSIESVIHNVELAIGKLPGEIMPGSMIMGVMDLLEAAMGEEPEEKLRMALYALEDVKTSSAATNLLLGKARSELELFINDIG